MSRPAQTTAALDAQIVSIVETIIAKLEAGAVPWAKPWDGKGFIPSNATTDRDYRGVINPMILWIVGEAFSGDTRWAGFGQWAKTGNPIKKGEKGTRICAPITRRFPVEGNTGEKVWIERVTGWKDVVVFNNRQTTNPIPDVSFAKVDPSIGFEKAAAMLKASKATVKHGGPRACFNLSTDEISLPEAGAFTTVADYWATAMHELVHWTGGKARLDRVKPQAFGSAAYAYEELVAELGSTFLCAQLGVDRPALMDNHTAYLQSWIKALRSDPSVLFQAALDAQRAVGFLSRAEEQTEE